MPDPAKLRSQAKYLREADVYRNAAIVMIAQNLEDAAVELSRRNTEILSLRAARDAAQAEIEQLRKDAERYRWLKKADGRLLCAIAYRVPAACGLSSDDVDSVIDAAIAAPGEARYMNYTPSADPT